MNFSVHFDDATLDRLNRAVETSGVSRNRLITLAVQEWLARLEAQDWPAPLKAHFLNPAPELEAGVVDFAPWQPREARK